MVSVKSYAKLNISLKVTGVENGYHTLDSVVCSVDKYDVISVKKRKDQKVLVTFTGEYGFVPKVQEETNAYKSAVKFIEAFNVKGVDVTVKRNIPEGSGMGGSSADIAGVLTAMKKLYKLDCDLKPLADSLGSDSGYMLNGGFARLNGRGEIVKPIAVKHNYYFVVIYSKNAVLTKDCFKLYDEDNHGLSNIDIDKVETAVINCDLQTIQAYGGNDLTTPAVKLNGEIEKNMQALKSLSPEVCFMTGSGSTCFSMYKEYEMATWAYSKLKKTYGKKVELLFSVDPSRSTFCDAFFSKKV